MRCRPDHLANVPQFCGVNAVVRYAVGVLFAEIAEEVGDESRVAAECQQGAICQ
jgi:hypothetical protein